MNEAIKLAIEKGGYRQGHIYCFEKDWRGEYAVLLNDQAQRSGTLTNEQILLDPLFWQALGKALEKENEDFIFSDNLYSWWLGEALLYNYLNLTGGDTGKFWNDLLNSRLYTS